MQSLLALVVFAHHVLFSWSETLNQCGVEPNTKQRRIVGGEVSAVGSFPWLVLTTVYNVLQALMHRDITRNGTFRAACGASLIHPKFVLTAAHCVVSNDDKHQSEPEKYFYLRFGKANSNPAEYFNIKIKKIFMHKDYDHENINNDIAVLETAENVPGTNRYVGVICLPSSNVDSKSLAGVMATTAGWGMQIYQKEDSQDPNTLRQITIPILNDTLCKTSYDTFVEYKESVSICAGDLQGKKDSCGGDSGGPLMAQFQPGVMTVVGLSSFGIQCAMKDFPGIYTRVSPFVPWIQQIIKENE